MLDEVLKTISLESVSLILLSRFKGRFDEEAIKTSKLDVLHEMEVLKGLLSPNLIQDMRSSLGTQHVLSFALRYRISQLALCGHLWSMDSSETHLLVTQEELTLFASLFDSYLKQGSYPIFGFNPLGIFLVSGTKGSCRVLDSYEKIACGEEGKPFCKDHLEEAWWRAESKPKLTLSKMFQFYSDLSNCDLYSEEDLEALLGKFWNRYRTWASGMGSLNVNDALEIFGLEGKEELSQLGGGGLRKAFHRLSMTLHPDQGGSAERFIKLKGAYQTLKSYL